MLVDQTGFPEEPFFDAATPNAFCVPDAKALNAPPAGDVTDETGLGAASNDAFPNAAPLVWNWKDDWPNAGCPKVDAGAAWLNTDCPVLDEDVVPNAIEETLSVLD